MKSIVLFDPSQGTQNLGDYIIRDGINAQMEEVFASGYVIRYSTHTPIARWYQLLKPGVILKCCRKADYKFLCGTNLFKSTLVRINSDWNIGLSSMPFYKGAVAIGCGMEHNGKVGRWITKRIYKSILSKKYIHSTRDEKTKEFLESLGFQAINTGCPTMWGLTKEHCAAIPAKKAQKVVFTVTDYFPAPEQDREMISTLRRNYDEIYFWPQGSGDVKYLQSLTQTDGIRILQPTLEAYGALLEAGGIDYVGTRLHAGIYALQKGVRSIILSVDNRARDIEQTHKLPTLERENVKMLEQKLYETIVTDTGIDQEKIERFRKQFL